MILRRRCHRAHRPSSCAAAWTAEISAMLADELDDPALRFQGAPRIGAGRTSRPATQPDEAIEPRAPRRPRSPRRRTPLPAGPWPSAVSSTRSFAVTSTRPNAWPISRSQLGKRDRSARSRWGSTPASLDQRPVSTRAGTPRLVPHARPGGRRAAQAGRCTERCSAAAHTHAGDHRPRFAAAPCRGQRERLPHVAWTELMDHRPAARGPRWRSGSATGPAAQVLCDQLRAVPPPRLPFTADHDPPDRGPLPRHPRPPPRPARRRRPLVPRKRITIHQRMESAAPRDLHAGRLGQPCSPTETTPTTTPTPEPWHTTPWRRRPLVASGTSPATRPSPATSELTRWSRCCARCRSRA